MDAKDFIALIAVAVIVFVVFSVSHSRHEYQVDLNLEDSRAALNKTADSIRAMQ
jgi:cell division protein FtsL